MRRRVAPLLVLLAVLCHALPAAAVRTANLADSTNICVPSLSPMALATLAALMVTVATRTIRQRR